MATSRSENDEVTAQVASGLEGGKRLRQSIQRALGSLMLFSIFMREATLIKGDGPAGIGELAIKALAMLVVVPLLIVSLAYAFAKRRRGYLIATACLAVFAALALVDACSDDKGHCRNWSVHLS